MVKLIGKRIIYIAIFISGNGSNLKSLIKKFKNNSKIKISLVLSNNTKAKGLVYAKKNKINYKIINYVNKKKAENSILNLLEKNKIDVVCLAGFMKILSKYFIKKFNKPILNIHPSLLPKYKGLNTHSRVIANKEEFSGCTVHLVTPILDSGKIIAQKKIKIRKNDNVLKLSKRILKQEHITYYKAIRKFVSSL